MMNTVFLKTLRDKRWFIFGWTLGLAALAALLVVFYPSMRQEGSFDTFMRSMPPMFEGMIGDLANLGEFSTFLASQLFDFRMQIIVGVMAVVLALGLTVGEEEKGQLRTTLSLPISRTSFLLQQWLAVLVIIAVTLLGTAVGILVTQITVNESIALDVLARLLFMSWLTMSTFATITYAAAAATGNRAFATLIGIATLAVSFILSTFSMGVEWLRDYEHFSLFYFFPAVDVVKDGIELKNVAVLVVVAIVLMVVAVIDFRRRDIA